MKIIDLVDKTYSEEKRLKIWGYFQSEFPNYIPIFVRIAKDTWYKFRAERDTMFIRIYNICTKRMKIKPYEGCFCLAEIQKTKDEENSHHVLLQTTSLCGDIYDKYKSYDHCLYVDIKRESVFG